jgi:signal transduction histidine kinase
MPFRVSTWNKFLSKLSLGQQRILILAIPFISLMMMSAGWLWSRQAEADAQWWISHTEDIIRESNSLHIQLVDAETGIRGYAITKNREFLEPYQQALTQIPIHLNSLKKLTTDNFNQQKKLNQIQEQIEQRLSLFVRLLNVIEENKQTPSLKSQLNPLLIESKTTMDLIRQYLNDFNDREWQLLLIHRQHLQQVRNSSNIVLGIIVFFSILAYWIATRLYYYSQSLLEQKAHEMTNLNQILANTNIVLQERNQELDRFTYIVSHDLKAPLRAIANLSEWLEEDLQNKLDEDTSQQLSLLRNRVHRMDMFINGLLEYSRVGKINVDKTLVDVHKLLEDIIDSLHPPETFEINIISEMPVFETQSLPLQQVFSNLISNGIKHHPREDGKIEISVGDRGEKYQFSVADDGLGIEPKYHEQIFEIFQTLVARDRKESTGIGLSIVKKIVENNGGNIWVDSQEGRGSIFNFTWAK